MPSVPWRVESSKIFKKIKKFPKFQKCPKSFPKVCKHVLHMFWGKLSEKFCPVFHGMSSLRKFSKKFIFKIPKMPKSVPKSIQTCFEHVLWKLFWKIFAQFYMECPVFENFQKNYFQNSKNAQKCSQKYPNVFWGGFFEKILCPVFHGGSSLQKFSKNYFQNSKNAQKCSQKYPNVFWGGFFEKF